jgi:hypothetical protein
MFARAVVIKVKLGCEVELTRTFEQEVIPLFRKETVSREAYVLDVSRVQLQTSIAHLEDKEMNKRPARFYVSLAFFVASLLTLAVIVSCGGNSSTTSAPTTTGTITTSLSDPPTCAAPNGPYQHVFVTITKVTANINSTAGPSDSGWQTLVDLTSSPKQIDLLSLAPPPAS